MCETQRLASAILLSAIGATIVADNHRRSFTFDDLSRMGSPLRGERLSSFMRPFSEGGKKKDPPVFGALLARMRFKNGRAHGIARFEM